MVHMVFAMFLHCSPEFLYCSCTVPYNAIFACWSRFWHFWTFRIFCLRSGFSQPEKHEKLYALWSRLQGFHGEGIYQHVSGNFLSNSLFGLMSIDSVSTVAPANANISMRLRRGDTALRLVVGNLQPEQYTVDMLRELNVGLGIPSSILGCHGQAASERLCVGPLAQMPKWGPCSLTTLSKNSKIQRVTLAPHPGILAVFTPISDTGGTLARRARAGHLF